MNGLFHKGQKNSDPSRLDIERDEAEILMRTERWQAEDTAAAGVSDKVASDKVASLCRKPTPALLDINVARLTEVTADDIIDRFLRADNLRIVAEEGEADGDIVTEAAFDADDDLASEELAEIYLAQGLKDMAKETYRKLSLLNPEKSVYFAELIAKIETN